VRHVFLDFDRTLFNTEAFYNHLELTHLEDVNASYTSANFAKFLYPDVIRFMQNCQSENYLCHLVTFGRRATQEGKLRLTGLEPYFSQLFYVEQGSKAEIIKNYLKTSVFCEKVAFIDDTRSHLEDFNLLIPDGIAIRMCRPGAKGSDIEDPRFQTCSNLDEFLSLLTEKRVDSHT